MKKLVVYYSLQGNTKLIARKVAEEMGAELLALKPEKPLNPRGVMKFLRGGKQVFFKEKPPLKPLKKDPLAYDLICIGTPVWAATFAPPVRTFLDTCPLKHKKLAFFCCFGGGPAGCLSDLEKALDDNEILGSIAFREPRRKDTAENLEKAAAWAKKISA